MKRAIIRRTEHYSCEVEIPDDWDEQALLDKICTTEQFSQEIDDMEYDECSYDVEIME